MKKFLLTAVFLTAISCSHSNQEAALGFNLNTEISNVGNSMSVNILVFDDRTNQKYVGNKSFGDEKINISTNKNLDEFLQEKIARSLILKGFTQGKGKGKGKGKDKTVEVHLKTLQYKAERGFPVGNSTINGVMKVSVRNDKTGEVFVKNYILDLDRKHFIVSLKATDEQIINHLLRELVKDVVEDEEFLHNLAK